MDLDFDLPLTRKEFYSQFFKIFKKNHCHFDERILKGRFKKRLALVDQEDIENVTNLF